MVRVRSARGNFSKAQRGQLVEDEGRYRDNLTALGNNAALRSREIDKLTAAENQIDLVEAAAVDGQQLLLSAFHR